MKASVFVGASLDGFIARTNGDLDWLPQGEVEDHAYDAFIATVDALVMGRNTYDKVLTFGTWPCGEKPVFVLSSRALPPAPAVPSGRAHSAHHRHLDPDAHRHRHPAVRSHALRYPAQAHRDASVCEWARAERV